MEQTHTYFGLLQPPSDMSFSLSASVTDGREMSLDSGIFHILQQQQQQSMIPACELLSLRLLKRSNKKKKSKLPIGEEHSDAEAS